MALGNQSRYSPFGSPPPFSDHPDDEFSLAPGAGGGYVLDDYNNAGSPFGSIFYHFRDWDNTLPHPFLNTDGTGAKVGDKIGSWTNPSNFGNAFSTKVYDGDITTPAGQSLYTTQPTLVERTYAGKTFRGLNFTGSEFLMINAKTLNDNTTGNPAEVHFSTSGSPWLSGDYKDSGASFLFVVDPTMIFFDEGPRIPANVGYDEYLLYSDNPFEKGVTVGCCGLSTDLLSAWPKTTNNGVVFCPWSPPSWFSYVSPSHWPFWTTNVKEIQRGTYGPQGWWTGFWSYKPPWAHNIDEGNPAGSDNWVGGSYNGWLLQKPDQTLPIPFDDGGYWKRPGLQALLLVFDGKDDLVKNELPPGFFSVPPPDEWAGVKLYAMSAPGPHPGLEANYGEGYIDEPLAKSVADNTVLWGSAVRGGAMLGQPLIRQIGNDDTYFFLGGMPPIRQENPQYDWDNNTNNTSAFGHGFKGIIYEFAAWECALNDFDRRRLFDQIKEKYGEGAIY